MTFYVTPVCRTIECTDYRHAQSEAKKLHPAGKALPIADTGVVRYDDTVHTHTLDTYA